MFRLSKWAAIALAATVLLPSAASAATGSYHYESGAGTIDNRCDDEATEKFRIEFHTAAYSGAPWGGEVLLLCAKETDLGDVVRNPVIPTYFANVISSYKIYHVAAGQKICVYGQTAYGGSSQGLTSTSPTNLNGTLNDNVESVKMAASC